jgi:ParB/RepB/Spo0J family partition protein
VAIDEIATRRETRQRRDLGDISTLASSISRRGLIHPIVVTRDLDLVAGERRLEACKLLNWDQIPVQFTDEVAESDLEAIELEENIKRQDISWQDRNNAIQRYHELQLRLDRDWTQEKTADELGLDASTISAHLEVAKAILAKPELARAETFSKVRGVVDRANARAIDGVIASLTYGPFIQSTNHIEPSIITTDFIKWASVYDGPRFNLLHCDFPYGIGSDSFPKGATQLGTYTDEPQTFPDLIHSITANIDRICDPSCHLIFWFSMSRYEETRSSLANFFEIDPYPLVWAKSDNVGFLPNPSHDYRRIYETAFFGTRGSRKIVRPVSNLVHLPTTSDIHPHEKPVAVLTHFFEALVDEHTRLLDPTCGSGSALRAARKLGAAHVFGIESDPEFAKLATAALERSSD